MMWHKVKYNQLFRRGDSMARKGFYITNKLALDKLDMVENQSEYVENLILKDVYSDFGGVEFEKKVHDTLDMLIMQIDEIRKTVNSKQK